MGDDSIVCQTAKDKSYATLRQTSVSYLAKNIAEGDKHSHDTL
jgi:hypothetical protein